MPRFSHPKPRSPHHDQVSSLAGETGVSAPTIASWLSVLEASFLVYRRKRFLNAGEDALLSFLRTEKGFEIDLLVHEAATVRPVEIKSAMTFHRNLVRNLETFAREEPSASAPTLLYDGAPVPSFGPRNVSVLNYRDWT